jgi:hypothetical protein
MQDAHIQIPLNASRFKLVFHLHMELQAHGGDAMDAAFDLTRRGPIMERHVLMRRSCVRAVPLEGGLANHPRTGKSKYPVRLGWVGWRWPGYCPAT